jgi:uncharacterized protein YjiS (DUF1127 family)
MGGTTAPDKERSMTALIAALSTACPAPKVPIPQRLIRRMTQGVRRMAARRQLAQLDDRMLRDIGFDRSDLASGRI